MTASTITMMIIEGPHADDQLEAYQKLVDQEGWIKHEIQAEDLPGFGGSTCDWKLIAFARSPKQDHASQAAIGRSDQRTFRFCKTFRLVKHGFQDLSQTNLLFFFS
jgi:hypothetical protein